MMCRVWPDALEPKEKCRRGYCSIDAIDPRDGKTWQVLLPDSKMNWVAAQGRGAALELADTVRWTLLHPRHIFRGLRDPQKDLSEDDWLCYVAVPEHAYDHKTSERRLAWENEVFMVAVTDERVLYMWYWCECDAKDRTLPEDYAGRFREKVL